MGSLTVPPTEGPLLQADTNEHAQGVSRFLEIKFASNSFTLAISLYPFAGKGVQGVKPQIRTPHICVETYFYSKGSYSPKSETGNFFSLT